MLEHGRYVAKRSSHRLANNVDCSNSVELPAVVQAAITYLIPLLYCTVV